ncbi:MAG TPA: hypothetical protein VGK74_15200 [Symbiobacteriaceae bacterium]|jgi:hypothetical protein
MTERMLDQRTAAVLESHLKRLQVRPGNGLKKYQNDALRAHPVIPDMLRGAVKLLVQTEQLFGGTDPVYIRMPILFQMLVDTEDDWALERPLMNRWLVLEDENDPTIHDSPEKVVGGLRFRRIPKRHISLSAWEAACIIARRIGLFAGGHHGCALSPEFRKQTRTAAVEAAPGR